MLTARVPISGDASRGLRLITGLTAVALVALHAYAGELAIARFLPGLSW